MNDTTRAMELADSLREKLLQWLPEPSRRETPVPGLALTRYDEQTRFYTPMVALVIQGFKRSMIGDHEANYGKNHCVVVGVDMPGVFHVTEASSQAPFLSLSVRLDRRIISRLIAEAPAIVTENAAPPRPIVVSEASEELLEAFRRLVNLLDTPSRIAVLAPLILREIHSTAISGR